MSGELEQAAMRDGQRSGPLPEWLGERRERWWFVRSPLNHVGMAGEAGIAGMVVWHIFDHHYPLAVSIVGMIAIAALLGAITLEVGARLVERHHRARARRAETPV